MVVSNRPSSVSMSPLLTAVHQVRLLCNTFSTPIRCWRRSPCGHLPCVDYQEEKREELQQYGSQTAYTRSPPCSFDAQQALGCTESNGIEGLFGESAAQPESQVTLLSSHPLAPVLPVWANLLRSSNQKPRRKRQGRSRYSRLVPAEVSRLGT